jgi:hypothetical protein
VAALLVCSDIPRRALCLGHRRPQYSFIFFTLSNSFIVLLVRDVTTSGTANLASSSYYLNPRSHLHLVFHASRLPRVFARSPHFHYEQFDYFPPISSSSPHNFRLRYFSTRLPLGTGTNVYKDARFSSMSASNSPVLSLPFVRRESPKYSGPV